MSTELIVIMIGLLTFAVDLVILYEFLNCLGRMAKDGERIAKAIESIASATARHDIQEPKPEMPSKVNWPNRR